MNNQEAAKMFTDAIRTFADKPNNIDNFEFYLAAHFDKWLEKYSNTPQGIAIEMESFAEMD